MARDQFVDRLIGADLPLGTSVVQGRAGFVLDEGPDTGPEIERADLVAVVTFDDYQPYLSASGRSLYTEVRLGVERLLTTDSPDAHPRTLALIYLGGAADTPHGVISYGGNLDRPFEIQPHHRYVVFLRHFKSGNFFTLDRSWELKGGVVYPNSAASVQRAEAGTSRCSGMREGEFLAVLPSLVGRP